MCSPPSCAEKDLTVILEHWGATADEIAGPMPGDDIVRDARIVATRSITLAAPPEVVFAWIRQMGFGRAGWYSYDILDNLGRRSAREIHPEWQQLSTGGEIPAGPVSFVAALVEPPRHVVMHFGPTHERHRKVDFSLAYDLRDDPAGTRLVTRVRARVSTPAGRLVEQLLLGPGDGVMVRRQLLNLALRVSAT